MRNFVTLFVFSNILLLTAFTEAQGKNGLSKASLDDLMEMLDSGVTGKMLFATWEIQRRELDSEAVVSALIRALNHEGKNFDDRMCVPYAAARALKNIDRPRAIDAFNKFVDIPMGLLESESWIVRRNASSFLGQIKLKKAIPTLVNLLDDAEPSVRYDASCAILQTIIEHKKTETPQGQTTIKKVTEVLVELLDSDRYWMRIGAAIRLIEINETKVMEQAERILREGLNSENPDVRFTVLVDLVYATELYSTKARNSIRRIEDILVEMKKEGGPRDQSLAREVLGKLD